MKADKKTLTRLYVDQGLSLREIAERLGLHADTIHYHLRRHEIEIRPQAKRSQLRKYRLGTLEKGIREKGVRGYAKELGIHENTLRHYLKRTKETLRAENGRNNDGK